VKHFTINTHKSAIRYGNELQCHCCGKAWSVKDKNPPRCLTKEEYNLSRLGKIRKELFGDSEPMEN